LHLAKIKAVEQTFSFELNDEFFESFGFDGFKNVHFNIEMRLNMIDSRRRFEMG